MPKEIKKKLKKTPKKENQSERKKLRNNSDKGVSCEITQRDNYEKTEEVIKSDLGKEIVEKLPASINYSRQETVNLGNFQSVRIGCSITLPCGTDEQDILDAFSKARNLVDEHLEYEADVMDIELGER